MSDTAPGANRDVAPSEVAARMVVLGSWGAAVAIAVGSVVLLGWMGADALPASIRERLLAMKSTTAVCLVLAGYSLWEQRAPPTSRGSRSARICAALVVLTGAATIVGQIGDFEADHLPFSFFGAAAAVASDGSYLMGPAVAATLVLEGLALLMLDVRVGRWFPAQWLTLAATLAALLASLGYLYDAPRLYAVSGFASIAPHAALSVLALGGGILLVRPRAGLMLPFSENCDAAFVARRMIPAVLLLPIVLGWLRLMGQRRGLYETEFGLAIYVLSNVVCMGGVTWWAAARLGRSEQERKAAQIACVEREQDLAVTTARKAAVVDAALDCILGMDDEGKIIEFNPAAEKTFGHRRTDVLGQHLADIIIPPSYRDAHRAGVRRLITTGEKRILGRRVELAAMRADGSEFPVELTVIRIPGEGPPSFEGFVRDLTEQKAAEAALRASEESKNAAHAQLVVSDRMASVGTLAAGVAHEINNPLAAVLANLEFAAEQVEALVSNHRDSAAVTVLQESLRDATEGADRVRQIVMDLRVFARVEEDRVESVDMHRTLDSTLRMAWNEIRHRARLVKAYGKDVPNVLGNASRLGQVFLNLVVNAAQAIPEGRADTNEIRVTTSMDSSGQVALEIRDTGAGMTDEVLSRLFTPFFTTKPPGVGTGLGLAICKRIVTNMGGDISVKSQPGVGTTFRVVLPATPRERARATKPPIAGRASRRGAVLVVDDDPMIGFAVRRALSGEHEVRLMTSARDALENVAEGQCYDVILCDMMMPVVTGMDFYRQLRETAPEQAERVVFLTGGAFTVAAREFLDRIPNACMEKPFQVQSLRALVNDRVK